MFKMKFIKVHAVFNVDHGNGHGLMTLTEQLPAPEPTHGQISRAGNFSSGKLYKVDERDATRTLAFFGNDYDYCITAKS